MQQKKFRLRKLTPMEKLVKARVILLKERPFFGTLVLHLRFIEADSEFLKKLIPTMGIDKWGRLFFSPEFVDSLTLEELLTVVCHEVHHAVLLHLDRRMSRDEKIWNYSADYVINGILLENGFQGLDGWLHNSEYGEWYAEEIYEDLQKKKQQFLDGLEKGQFDVHVYQDVDNADGSNQGDQGDKQCDNCNGSGRQPCDTCKGSGKDGNGKPCPDCSGNGTNPCPQCGGQGTVKSNYGHGFGAGDEKQHPHWDKVLKEAYVYAKNQGKAPLGMERIIEGLTQGQVPWQAIVRKFVVATLPKDYTYSKPHKRSQLAGFYIPSIKREAIDICVGIDTSGSVSDHEYMEFISEIVALDKAFQGRINFHIVTCDAAIHTVDEFGQGFDPRKLRARGYGGTLFKPVFEHVKAEKPKAKLLIYFTDLYGDQDHLEGSRYNFHTLWVLTANSNQNDPPFGQWVRLKNIGKQDGRRRRF